MSFFRLAPTQKEQGTATPRRYSRLLFTFRRFPLAIAASVIGTLAALLLVDIKDASERIFLTKVLTVALMVLPLLVVARIRAEKKGRAKGLPDGFSLFLACGAVAYFFIMGNVAEYAVALRQGLWTVCAFLLLLLLPFPRKDEKEECWHFNASLARAFAIGFVWAVILFVGLSAAFAGIDYLLTVSLPFQVYFRLWVVMAGFVSVVVFLAAVPTDLDDIRSRPSRSRLMAGFLHYLLIPLVGFYLVILYAYAAKIIVVASWPKGSVAGFILGFCGVGILAYLFLFPYPQDESHAVTRLFRRAFFPLTLPLAALLLLAVWRRVSEYGFTVSRYLGVAAAFWLAAMALYFIMSRRKDLRLFPVSLFLLALFASFGPWGALSVAEHSQVARLEDLLENGHLLVDGRLQKTKVPPTVIQEGEISRMVTYLHRIGRTEALSAWSGGKIIKTDTPHQIAGKLGIDYRLANGKLNTSFFFSAEATDAVDITGFRQLWRIDLSSFKDRGVTTTLPGKMPLRLVSARGLQKVVVKEGNKPLAILDFEKFAEGLERDFPGENSWRKVPPGRMVIDSGGVLHKVRVLVSQISGRVEGGKTKVQRVEGALLFDTR